MNTITVYIPSSFEIERRYIIDIILNEFLGLLYEVKVYDGNDYILCFSDKKVIINDHFFSRIGRDGKSYLDSKNIPSKVLRVRNQFTINDDIPCIFGNARMDISNDTIVCGLDIFSSAFFMLTRWEEEVLLVRDSHNRFPASASLAYQNNFLSRPVVNEYTEMLWNILEFLKLPQSRKNREFELILTHDVDHIRKWSHWSQVFLTMGADLLKRKDIKSCLGRWNQFLSIKRGKINDPFDTFNWIMDLSESVNLRSHFYFMSGGNSSYDNNYSIFDPLVVRLVGEIKNRGHIVGFHPSYNSYNDFNSWSYEKEQLEQALGITVKEGRQHYLRFQPAQSWQIWNDNNMEIDSTCGYADKEGFRCGTGDEFKTFNVYNRTCLNVKERPLVFMESRDFTCGGNVEDNIFVHDLFLLISKAKQVQSKMTILFHNSSFVHEEYIRQYLEVLQCVE